MADTSLKRQGVALYQALTSLMPAGSDRLEMNLHDIVTNGGAAPAFTVDGELNENAIKQAWRYLATIGSVENLGPRFKRPVRSPDEIDTSEIDGRGSTSSGRGGRRTSGRKATRTKKAAAARKTTRKTTKAAKATTAARATKATRGTRASRSTAIRSTRATKKTSGRSARSGSTRARRSVKANGAMSAVATPTPSGLAGQLSGFQAQLETSLQSLQRLRQEINESYEHLARLEDEHNTIVSDLVAFRENLGDTNQRSFVDSIVGDNLWTYAPRS